MDAGHRRHRRAWNPGEDAFADFPWTLRKTMGDYTPFILFVERVYAGDVVLRFMT